jgi:hypothetical protein
MANREAFSQALKELDRNPDAIKQLLEKQADGVLYLRASKPKFTFAPTKARKKA